MTRASEATTWFLQAESDVRTADALSARPSPMMPTDIGCHVAAMCAQAVEKSIKGYVIVNGGTPKLGHRPDKYLATLLTPNNPLLKYQAHYRELSALFGADTKGDVRQLLDLTPGGLGNRVDVPTTEYPWREDGAWARSPVGAAEFASSEDRKRWLRTAHRVTVVLRKLAIAAGRGDVL